jgi:hypothetical protein
VLTTNSFSLANYSSGDEPTLYFNYYLNTQDASSQSSTNLQTMFDSARVEISEDGGQTWNLVATNNPFRAAFQKAEAELPYYQSENAETGSVDSGLGGLQAVQPLFDSTTTNTGWRQARIDLSDYAGQNSLELRFDFSTAGTTFNPEDLAIDAVTGRANPYANSNVYGNQFGTFQGPNVANGAQNRGLNNDHEGWYIDDVTVGFAERGEMVTSPAAGLTSYDTLTNNPFAGNPTKNPDPAAITEVQTGSYQLEIRRGTEFGANVNNLKSDISLDQSFDTNYRFADAYSLIAPSGAGLAVGETFTLNDGIHSVTFEFVTGSQLKPGTDIYTITGTSLAGGGIAIGFTSGDTAQMVADNIVSAIDGCRTLVNVSASDEANGGQGVSNPAINVVNLFGVVEVTGVSASSNQLAVGLAAASITESSINDTGTITRSGTNLPAIVVTLSAIDVTTDAPSTNVAFLNGQATTTVSFLAGQTTATFSYKGVVKGSPELADGTRTVLFKASAAGYTSVGSTLDVTDDPGVLAQFTVSLNAGSVAENSSAPVAGTVKVNTGPVDGDEYPGGLTVNLSSLWPTAALVGGSAAGPGAAQATVTIPVGSTQANFFVFPQDDNVENRPGGLRDAEIVAAAAGVISGSAMLSVTDDKDGTLAYGVAAWQSIGPAPILNGQTAGSRPVSGRITGIAADPKDPNTVYIAAAGGGVWKTTNATSANASWTPLTDNVTDSNGNPVPEFMGAIAETDATSGTNSGQQIVYAGTGEANNSGDSFYGEGILVSRDGGNTWKLQNNNGAFDGDTVSKIVIDPSDPTGATAYSAISDFGVNGSFPSGTTGIWKTTDYGQTWTNETAANGLATSDAWSDVVIDPHMPSTLFAADGTPSGTADNGVYVSTNSGVTWTLMTGTNASNGAQDGRIVLALYDDGTTDELFVSIEDPTTDGLHKMLESTNPSATSVFTDLTTNVTKVSNYLGRQGWYDTTLAIDPTDPNYIYAAGVFSQQGPTFAGSPLESFDGGQTWTDIATDPAGNGPHTDAHAVAFDANGNLFDGDDGGIYQLSSPTNAVTQAWTSLNGNLNITQFTGIAVDPDNANIVYGGSQDNGVEEYTGSTVWNHVDSGDGGMMRVDPTNPNFVYVTQPYTGFWLSMSADGGATWSSITAGVKADFANFYPPVTLDSAGNVYFGSDYLNFSSNHGATWSQIGTPGTNGFNPGGFAIDAIAVSPTNNNVVYVSVGGDIFVTQNAQAGGNNVTWTQVNLPNNRSTGGGGVFAQDAIAVDPSVASGGTAYAVIATFTGTTGNHVFKTTNFGATWTDISSSFPLDTPCNAVAVSPDGKTVYVGTDVGVYSTSDGGTIWTVAGIGLPNAKVVDLEYVPGLKVLAAGTHGRGAWLLSTNTAGSTVSLSVAKPQVTDDAGLLTNEITITRSDASTAATVTITSSDPALASVVPTAVTLGVGQLTAQVNVRITDPVLAQTPETVIFTPTLGSAESSGAVLDVVPATRSNTPTDNDTPALSLSVPAVTMIPGTLTQTLTATVTRNTPTTEPLVVTLLSLNPQAAAVPPTVTIPAGQASATFTISGVGAFTTTGNVMSTGSIVAAADGYFSASGSVTSESLDAIVHYNPPVPAVLGDVTKPRPQGEVILYANQISNSLNDGILVEPSISGSPGNTNSNLPHPGGLENTPTLDTSRLADGVVIKNNLIYGVGGAGIAYFGASTNAGGPLSVVPFGRIVNNTIYGGTTPSGVGINLLNNASPTLLNNILANLQIGVQADSSSQQAGTVLGEELYQNNATNSNYTVGSFAIQLKPTDPLFINPGTNPATANFYLQEYSKAIDSSINSLQDRTAVTAVTGPLGIPPSPIIAPSYDLYGQLRVPDPNVAPFPGLGQNVFIDRGAIQRVDNPAVGLTAALLNPVDNGPADQNPLPNVVFVRGQNLSEFTIQLSDGTGPGVYDASLLPYAYAQIAAAGFGANMTGDTITVTSGGKTMTFEFTTGSLPKGDTNIPIVVSPGDSPATLAQEAAQTIDGATGFNTPGLAMVNTAANSESTGGSRIRFAPGVTVSVKGGELSAGTGNTVDVIEDGRLLTPGVDYYFDYDNNNHVIHLVAASGVWLNGHEYDIYLDNGTQFDPYNPSATPVGITDRAGNLLQANAADGYTHFRLLLANTTNTAPVIDLPSTLPASIYEHTSVTFSVADGDPITIFDVDAGIGSETLTLTANTGTFTLSNAALAGLQSLGIDTSMIGNGTGTITITAPLGDPTTVPPTPGLDTALDGLTYTPDDNFDSQAYGIPATISISVNDDGNSPPPALTATAGINFNVMAVNDPPSTAIGGVTITSGVTLKTGEDVPVVFSAANNNQITVNDSDVQNLTLSAGDVNSAAVGGVLINPLYNNQNNLYEEQITVATPLNSGVPPIPAAAGYVTLGSTAGLSFINGSSNSSGFLDFTGTLFAIDTAMSTLTFTENPEFSGTATVTFFTNDNGNVGVGPAPTYSPAPYPLTDAETITINVSEDHDAPVIVGNPPVTFGSILEDAGTTGNPGNGPTDPALSVGTMLNSAPAGTITFPAVGVESGAAPGIAVTAAQTTNGTWYYSLDGTNWTAFPAVANTDALLLSGSDFVKFVPNHEYEGQATLSFVAWDGTVDAYTTSLNNNVATADTAGTTVDLTVRGSGGSWPFSSYNSPATATLTVSPGNDAPTLTSASVTVPSIPEDVSATADAGVQIKSSAIGADVTVHTQAEGGTVGIAVTGVTQTSNGTWQWSVDDTNWNTIPASTSPSTALLLDGKDWLRFLPNPEFSDPVVNAVPTLTFVGWDETWDVLTGRADSPSKPGNPTTVNLNQITSDPGGSLPFSESTPDALPLQSATAQFPVAAGLDAPSLTSTSITLASIPEDIGSGGKEPADNGFQISSAASGLASYIKLNDAGAKLGIAVTGIDDTNGQWQWSSDDTNWQPISTSTTSVVAPTFASALLLDGKDWLRFLPKVEFSDATGAAPTFSFAAWDETADALNPGAAADAASTPTTLSIVNLSQATVQGDPGGSLPFSESPVTHVPIQTATVTLPVTAAMDAPSLTQTSITLSSIPEDIGSTGNPADNGFQISSAAGGLANYVKLNDVNAKLGVAITGVDNANGLWQWSTDDKNWNTIASTTSTSAALLLDGSDWLRFLPNLEFSEATGAAPTFSFAAWDETPDAINPGAAIDPPSTSTALSIVNLTKATSDPGGTLPFSESPVGHLPIQTATVTLPVTPAMDAPSLTKTSITLTSIPEDVGSGGNEPADNGFQIASAASGLANYIKLNAVDAKLGVAITGVDNSDGLWQWSTDDKTWNTIASTTSASAALLLDGNDWLRFLPNLEFSDATGAAPTFSFAAWDETPDAINPGAAADPASMPTALSIVNLTKATSDPGGTLPFSESPVGHLPIQTATVTLPVTPAMDAPSLTQTSISLASIPEDIGSGGKEPPDNGFQISSTTAGLASYVQLVDVNAKLGIAITGVNDSNGTWQWSTDDTNWNTIPATSSLSAALLLDGSDWLRFLPNVEFSDAVGAAPTFSFAAWDETPDALNPGAAADPASTPTAPSIVNLAKATSDPGGTLPFSESPVGHLPIQTATVTLPVTPAMDAPSLTQTSITLTSIPEDAGLGGQQAADNGFQVSSTTSGLASDIKLVAVNAKLGIAVTGVDESNGLWQWSTDDKSWNTIAATTSTSAALLLDGSDWLRFLPDPEFNDAVGAAPTLHFAAWDETPDALIGGAIDPASTPTTLSIVNLTKATSDPGGTLPFSESPTGTLPVQTATVTLPVTPAMDAPKLTSTAITLAALPEDAGTGGNEPADNGFQISDSVNGFGSDITLRAVGAKVGVAVTGVDESNGLWQWSTDDKNWVTIASTTSTAAALLLDGSDWLRFLPNEEFSDAVGAAPTLSFAAWDETDDAITGVVDAASTPPKLTIVNLAAVTSDPGGTLPFSESPAGTLPIQTATATLPVTPALDAPRLTTTSISLAAIPEDAGSGGGQPADNGFQISSSANGLAPYVGLKAPNARLGIAVTGVDESNGLWQWSIDDTNWNTIASTTSTATALLLDGSDWLRFLPNEEFNDNTGPAPSITFAGWDETWDSLTGGVDLPSTHASPSLVNLTKPTSDPGGTLPFSESPAGTLPIQTATASMAVTPANDAPTLSTAQTLHFVSTLENTTSPVGSPVSAMLASNGANVVTLKAIGAKLGIAVTGVTQTANGTWQVSLDDGQTWPLTINPTTAPNNALLLDASAWVRFVPDLNFSGDDAGHGAAPALTFVAWDQTFDSATLMADLASTAAHPSIVDLTKVNYLSNSAPFSTYATPATAKVDVLFVNQAPTFIVSSNPPAVNENSGFDTVSGFATVSPSQYIPPQTNEANQTITSHVLSDSNPGLFAVAPAVDGNGTLTYTLNPNVSGTAQISMDLQDNGGTANGGHDTSAAQTFTITVNFVNQPPSFTIPNGAISANENSPPQALVNFATNISPSQQYPPQANQANEKVQFNVVGDTNPGLFASGELPAITPAGTLTYAFAPNVSGTAQITVDLQNNGGTANGGQDTSTPQTFTITANFVNEPPSFTIPNQAISVNENSPPQTVTGFITNISPAPESPPPANQASETVSFTTTVTQDSSLTNTGVGLFAVPPAIDAHGTLTYTLNPDVSGTALVRVVATNSGGTANGGNNTSAQTFTIVVNFVNQPPSFTIPNSTVSTSENAGVQLVEAFASNISPSQKDPPQANQANEKVHFNVTGDTDPSLFAAAPAIDSLGDLTYTLAANQSGIATITVDLQNDGGTANGGHDTSSPQTFTISAGFVNSPPSFTLPSQSVSGNENSPPQTVAGFVTNISPAPENPPPANQAGETVSFTTTVTQDSSLTSTGVGLFAIPPAIDASGTLTYTLNPNVSGTATVSVVATNNGGTANGGNNTSASQTFTIVVKFVNQPPSFVLSGNPPPVNEFDLQVDPPGTTGAQSVPNFATSISPSPIDPPPANEATQTVHFNVVGDTNSSLFAVPPVISSGGTLNYILAPEVSGSATITVDLQDNGGTANGGNDTSPTQTFTITVNFVNDPPVLTHLGPDQVVNEDSGTATVTGFASANPGQGVNQQNETITYLVTAANTSLFSVRPAIDPTTGTLTFTPAAHVFGSTAVTVVVQDSGGTANGGRNQSSPATFHVTIDQINHAPTLKTPLPTVPVNENAADFVFNSLASVFDDLDTDQGVGDPMTLSVVSKDPGLVTASLSSTNPSTATLTLHFLANEFGSGEVDLIATDQAGSVTDPISVTVAEVNEAPSFMAGGNQRVTMNAGPVAVSSWATVISDAANPPSETLSFVVTGDTNPSLFAVAPTVNPATGTLTFTPAPNQSGKATITVVLENSGGTANGGQNTSAPQTFTIEVAGTPTAINHSYVLSTGSSSAASVSDGVLVGDSDPNGDPITAQLVTPPANGTVTLNANGSFSYVKGPNFEGLDSFTYRVSNGLLASSVATVNITSYEATIVTKLYNQVLGRAPDTQGLEYWTNQIQHGQSYGVIAKGIFDSDEHIDPIIEKYYQQFLLRAPDAQGLAYWAGVWQAAGGPEPVIAGMITSPEFFASAAAANPTQSKNAAWVTELYARLLNRTSDNQGLQYWTGQLDSGAMTPTQVVNGFQDSQENFQNLVTGYFNLYLGRNPTSSELATYVAQFEQGSTDADIQIEIIDLPEYANSPPPPASGSVRQLS